MRGASVVAGTGAAAGGARRAGHHRPAAGFAVRAEGAAAPAGAPRVAGLAGDSLLALQAAARRDDEPAGVEHADVILDGLGLLQRAMLSGDAAAGRAALESLAGLAGAARPAATDPALAEILDSVALRAEIELARRGLGNACTGG